MSGVLFTFPGQGSQRAGMLHALPDAPVVRQTIDAASRALGRNVLDLDTDHALESTIAVQLCLLVAGVAGARLVETISGTPDMVAGLSIGAYPAAVVAGVLDFDDAIRLVARRAALMEQAFPSGYGMLAISGLNQRAVEHVIDAVHSAASPVYLANLNAEQQMVIAGSDSALARAGALAIDRGARAAERLRVPVPSHCELLAPAAAELARAFEGVALARPRMTYLSSSAARPMTDAQKIGADLATNMAHPVRWHETMRLAWERGARLAVEMPAGHVLTRLASDSFADAIAISFDETRTDSIVALIERTRAMTD
ncbi:malonate decarboxylase subunit epsilon [Pararobbsia silviterrae]|uniref:Malonyl CoA-acyl carrier protein transacylase n=1 Tax=Pararobbsia silviterrae TaxID=1792498 RepID=A0A494XYS8_9BURK|nr:malonate decarboxylase subunit epsilon [Pararobbsia silviterrae]RKP55735.1 malonate decarboxylase subunit epsilon [Pararobbsia silviterrae]